MGVMTTTVYTCDICGGTKTGHDENTIVFNVTLPFITDCEWTEGKPTDKRIEFEKIDICKKCLMKATNLTCGFRGQDKRFLTET